MRQEIAELFLEAQDRLANRARAFWSRRQALEKLWRQNFEVRELSKDRLYRAKSKWPVVPEATFVASAGPNRTQPRVELPSGLFPTIGVSPCPVCGGVLQQREGNPRPIHIGTCNR
jgi:hypothetical protein